MNDLSRELTERFPRATSNAYCEIYCGMGWKDILCEALSVLEACHANVAQIKEKFGELRIYYEFPEEPPVWHYIACLMAEELAASKSIQTCEDCGKPAKLTQKNSGWLVTLCPTCLAKIEPASL